MQSSIAAASSAFDSSSTSSPRWRAEGSGRAGDGVAARLFEVADEAAFEFVVH